jgi:hypothetical protein
MASAAFLARGQDMSVGVRREPDGGVPRQLHDGAQVLGLVEEERGGAAIPSAARAGQQHSGDS